jgi:hypothetical protein
MEVFRVVIALANSELAHDNEQAPDNLAHMLEQVAHHLRNRTFSDMAPIPIVDRNGNRVGTAGVMNEESSPRASDRFVCHCGASYSTQEGLDNHKAIRKRQNRDEL